MTNRILDTLRGYNLDLAGTPDQGRFGVAPYVGFNGSTNYASRPSGSLKGLSGFTAGGWFQATSNDTLMGVWQTSNQVWRLHINTLAPTFYVSGSGADNYQVAHPANIDAATWYFIAGRYTPSTEIAIWVNGTKTTYGTGIPAALYNSAAQFVIGGAHGGANLLTGKASLCWMSHEVLDDAYLTMLFEMGRHLFGA